MTATPAAGLRGAARRGPRLAYRWTKQRQAVPDVLRAADTHVDADQVYRLAREGDARLSLSTAYRTLAVVNRLGVVRELHLGEGHHHYEFGGRGGPNEVAGTKPDHSHLGCRACGAVVEFSSPLLERLKREPAREHGYDFQVAELELFAACSRCAAMGTASVAGDEN